MNPFIRQFGKPSGILGKLLGKVMAVSNRKMHRAVLSELKDNSKLLEIGFGSGHQLEMISGKYPVCELTGIDISADMLDIAKKRLGTKAGLYVCDCERTDFPDGYFDYVITTDTCYFWNDPAIVLHEIKRILSPNGRLILAYNSMYARAVHKSDPAKGLYDDAGIEKAVTDSGMKILSRKPCGMGQAVVVRCCLI